MKTNFKDYLEKKNAQKIIDKMAKKYEGKKIVFYGAGFFASDLFKNYDFSKMNVLGVADLKFQDNTEGDFYGFKKLGTYDLLELDFDVLFITAYDDEMIKDFLVDDLFAGEDKKITIKPLIKMGLFEYIKLVIKGEL